MCYVHNQWYNISCATLYNNYTYCSFVTHYYHHVYSRLFHHQGLPLDSTGGSHNYHYDVRQMAIISYCF